MIKVIVDSTCDLSEELIKEHDIQVLPLKIRLEDQEYEDKVTIQVEDVYDAMRKGVVPMTSQPSPVCMNELFTSYCRKGYDFIYLAFSSKLSGTYQLAVSIIEELKGKYPEIRQEAVDSKGGSMATGLIALQAAKLSEAGYNFETVLRAVRNLIEHVEHIFTITDLKWLTKGGRISKSEGLIGNMLDIKPILDVKDGVMEVIKKIRGKKKALNMVADILIERMQNFPEQTIGISHADDLNTALELVEIIKQKNIKSKIMINKIGSVLGSHLGIGGVGVFFFNMQPDLYIE